MILRKTTKELLGESLHELSERKPVDKITVREIVENCGMAPATFYRHFHDKYELIAWIYNYQMEDVFMDFCEGLENWRQVLLDMVSILDRDRSFYRNAFRNTVGQNSFYLSTHRRCAELLVEYIRAADPEGMCEELLFDAMFYLRGASLSIYDWFVNDPRYSIEALTEYLYNAVPERLKPYLHGAPGGGAHEHRG